MESERTPLMSASQRQFTILYFAAASSFTKLSSESLSAPLPLAKLFDVLECKYPGMREKVLNSCAVTVNLEYVDMDEEGDITATKEKEQTIIQQGDEVAIIPPTVSSHGGSSSSARRCTLFTDRSPKAPITAHRRRSPAVELEHEMDIDPRLRGLGDGSNASFNQQPRSSSYPNPLAPTVPTPQQQNSDPPSLPSLTGGQNHSYYPSYPTTPQSAYPNPSTHASAHSGAPQYDSPDQGSEDHAPSQSAQYNADGGNDSTARSRACEACRSLKVRCEPDPVNPEGTCKRCAKAGRTCIVTVPNRKRQKKTDSRVAELEKKIDALTASLHATRGQDSGERSTQIADQPPSAYPPPPPPPSAMDSLRGGWMGGPPSMQDGVLRQSLRGMPTPPTITGPKRKRSDDIGAYGYTLETGKVNANADAPSSQRPKASTPAIRDNMRDYIDVVDRQIIDSDTAQQIFQRYITIMAPLMPAVVFPPDMSGFDVRMKKPLLFLSILSVASGRIRPDLQLMLTEETHRLFAEHIIIKGHKSLELVQALLVSTLWYQPPEQYEELKFYQLIHIAATMAIDIGMGKRSKPAEKKFMGMWKDNPWKKSNVPDPDAVETRRTWLGCYFLCANAAMALRRPMMVRWQAYMDECLEMLESCPNAYASDRYLCQWIKLQHIAEDVAFQFSMDDPTGWVGVTDAKTQYALKGFKGQLDAWRRDVSKEQYTPTLILSDHVVNLFVHEVAMHTDQNAEDFKPPYSDPNLQDSVQLDITPAQVGALTNCLEAIHNIFDTFLSLDIELVRALPTIHLVRTTYSGVALIKLYSSVSIPGSKLEKVFNPEDLKVEYYLDSILSSLGKAAEDDYSKPAAKFLQILGMLKSWYQKRKEGVGKSGKEANQFGYGPHGCLPPLSASDGSSSQWSVQTPSDGSRKQDNAGNTPLHLLSAVAMNDPNAGGNMDTGALDNGTMYKTPQGFGSDANMIEQMGFGGGDLDQAMGLGFGVDDISALFMEDPFLNFTSLDGSSAGYMDFKSLT